MGDLNLGVMLRTGPPQDAWIFRKIEWAEFLSARADRPFPVRGTDLKLASDIGICQVQAVSGSPFQPLISIQSGIRGSGLALGKGATAIGYDCMQDTVLEEREPGVVTGDFGFDIYVSTGTILEHLPDNSVTRRALTPGPCFRASLKLPAGMSGSPIFDDEGIYVHGVASTGMQEQGGLAHHCYGSMLAASMQISISRLGGKSLLDLLAAGSHGMTRLYMAGS